MAESLELVGVGVKLHHAEDGQFSLAFKYTFDTQTPPRVRAADGAGGHRAGAGAASATIEPAGSAAAVAMAPPERKVSVTIDGAPTDLGWSTTCRCSPSSTGGRAGSRARRRGVPGADRRRSSTSGGAPSDWRPEHALRQFGGVPGLRILVCGGDGTCGWLLSAMDAAGVRVPMAVMPLGTGNDLARVLRWGAGFTRAMGRRPYLERVAAATPHELDRWTVRLQLPGTTRPPRPTR